VLARSFQGHVETVV